MNKVYLFACYLANIFFVYRNFIIVYIAWEEQYFA